MSCLCLFPGGNGEDSELITFEGIASFKTSPREDIKLKCNEIQPKLGKEQNKFQKRELVSEGLHT